MIAERAPRRNDEEDDMDIGSVPEKAYAASLKSAARKRFASLAELGVSLEVESVACETGIKVDFALAASGHPCPLDALCGDIAMWIKELGLVLMLTRKCGDLRRRMVAILPARAVRGFLERNGLAT